MHTLLSPLFFALALLDGAGFAPIGGRHGVEVFERKDSPAIELAAVGEINATPVEVQAVLVDYASHPRFVPRLVESRVLERRPGELYVYERLQLPLIDDRDYTLRVTYGEGLASGLQFGIASAHGPAPRVGMVRMTSMLGRWDLESIRDGRATRVTYRVRIEFGGSVPRWMVRGGAAKELPGLFDGLRFETALRRLHGARVARE